MRRKYTKFVYLNVEYEPTRSKATWAHNQLSTIECSVFPSYTKSFANLNNARGNFITISQRFHWNTWSVCSNGTAAKRLPIDRHCLRYLDVTRDLQSPLAVAAKVISKVRPFSHRVPLFFRSWLSARRAGVARAINVTRHRLRFGRRSSYISRAHALIRPWLFNAPGNVAGRGTKACSSARDLALLSSLGLCRQICRRSRYRGEKKNKIK